jgi:tRNA 2-thiouridine synthesizing protein A
MPTTIDSRGAFCPGPLTDLFKAYRSAKQGDELELLATDPAAKPDVTAWCKKTGNQLVSVNQDGNVLKILVKVTKKA